MAANEDVDLSPAALHLESPDGRSFVVRGPASQRPRVGDYLELDTVGGPLAFVEEVLSDAAGAGFVASGSLVGESASASDERARWAQAPLRPTQDAAVEALLSGSDPRLHLGHLVDHAEVGVALIPKRLNRHTFWCGQSGSGKTYALGVLLERILLTTRLPMVVFDPNSDFVRLGEMSPGADPESVAALADRDIVVLRPGDERSPLHVLFKEMTPRARAAVLRLDPVVDRAEYNALLGLMADLDAVDTPDIVGHLHSLGDPDATALAQRLQNLGVLEWKTTWAYGAESATAVIDRRPAATVLDLGGYDRNEEQLTVTLAVLDDLWARRAERRPLLLVIDEAHNLCPPDPETPLGVAVRDRLIQIAAEGRKYGLWLLLSTQRPSKVHPGIVSQCDNLTLMRMNSRDDLDQLSAIFGFVPRGLLAQAARFRQGEALVGGGFVPMPSIVRVRGRVTPEGGIDVPVPMP
ncbi:ATP-binding protein [Humibacillus xanthopallidus]|uniref:ATP-binding protein n=1 Tax=Humibacillus xanthopallidus TaxID=412689 RepID=UPI003851796A